MTRVGSSMRQPDTSRTLSDERRHRPLVLLVDDNVQQRDMYEVALAPDFKIVTATRGADAIALARARRPDAIVLDVRMPGMDGLEVCEHLKSDPATESIPVVMLTGASDPRLRLEGMEAGAAAVLTKPCTPATLLQAISAACGKAGGPQ
jgi:CheY-like chemotaxis protein